MSNTGSFKRRSLKLRRSHRESTRRGGDQSDAESIKRSDSMRSKRKVSSISDRSDISDVHMDHDISGEESPGILSDDGQHESPSDGAADIEEGISTRGMPWLRVSFIFKSDCKFMFLMIHSAISSRFYCCPIHSTINALINTSAILVASGGKVEPVPGCWAAFAGSMAMSHSTRKSWNFLVSVRNLAITRTTTRKKRSTPKELKVDRDHLFDVGKALPIKKKGSTLFLETVSDRISKTFLITMD